MTDNSCLVGHKRKRILPPRLRLLTLTNYKTNEIQAFVNSLLGGWSRRSGLFAANCEHCKCYGASRIGKVMVTTGPGRSPVRLVPQRCFNAATVVGGNTTAAARDEFCRVRALEGPSRVVAQGHLDECKVLHPASESRPGQAGSTRGSLRTCWTSCTLWTCWTRWPCCPNGSG